MNKQKPYYKRTLNYKCPDVIREFNEISKDDPNFWTKYKAYETARIKLGINNDDSLKINIKKKTTFKTNLTGKIKQVVLESDVYEAICNIKKREGMDIQFFVNNILRKEINKKKEAES